LGNLRGCGSARAARRQRRDRSGCQVGDTVEGRQKSRRGEHARASAASVVPYENACGCVSDASLVGGVAGLVQHFGVVRVQGSRSGRPRLWGVADCSLNDHRALSSETPRRPGAATHQGHGGSSESQLSCYRCAEEITVFGQRSICPRATPTHWDRRRELPNQSTSQSPHRAIHRVTQILVRAPRT